MKWLYRAVFATILTAMAFATAAADEAVSLRRMPPLGTRIDSLPRVAGKPDDKAAFRINQALAAEDADTKSSASDCRRTGKQNSDFARSVTVSMRGAGYLSVIVTQSWYCGGAYPDWNTTPFVFDLSTGATVDWKRLLPIALVEGSIDYTNLGEGLIVSSRLTNIYVNAASNAECRDVLKNWAGGLGFVLWPDAAAEGIAIEANNLPHVVKACAPALVIAMPELRGLGLDPAFLAAIDEAHRRGWYDKPRGGH
jgi:hypothetical protein